MNDQPDDWVAKGFSEMRQQRGPLLGEPVKPAQRPFAPAEEEPRERLLPPKRTMALMASRVPPERDFIDYRKMLPTRCVIMLTGDGGLGKGRLMLQLGVAMQFPEVQWLNIDVQPGPVMLIDTEDEEDEINRRIRVICANHQLDMARGYQLDIRCLVGRKAQLASLDPKGKMFMTDLFRELRAEVLSEKPMLVVIDNVAKVYGGNENDREMVQEFVGHFNALAIEADCTVILVAHPSKEGIASGGGTSGSTAWHNAARARLYLTVDKDDRSLLTLTPKKNNYARLADPMTLRLKEDGLIAAIPTPKAFERFRVAHVDQMVEACAMAEYRVSPLSPQWAGYKVAEITEIDIGEGLPTKSLSSEQTQSRKEIASWLNHLLKNKVLQVVQKLDEKRRPRGFYAPGRKERDDEDD